MIATGGMGAVWRASDELLGRPVALKQLRLVAHDPDVAETARKRVLREARVAASLHHPNVVTIFDVIVEGGEPWLVLEYVPSRTLGDVVRERGVLDVDEAARIGRGLAAALVAAHERGIVHRDVKPANVLLGGTGAVKLTDFGISRTIGDHTLTATGMVVGTPAYLAPEVAGGADATASSDIFGLGATLYAALEGASPFGSDDNILLLLRRASEGRVEPPVRAGRLTEPLLRMLDADPARRPTAEQVLELLTDPVPVPADAPTTDLRRAVGMVPDRVRPSARRRWLLVGAAVTLVAALVATATVIGRGGAVPGLAAVASASTTSAAAPCDKSRGDLVVATILPVTGSLPALAGDMRNAVQLAVDQANTACTVPGYRLVLRVVDDASLPATAADAAAGLAADPAVVGVIGALQSKITATVQPILGQAGIAMIAPADVQTSFTRGTGSVPARVSPGFFSVYANNLYSGLIAANHLVRVGGAKRVAVVDDGKSFNKTARDSFSGRAAGLLARVVARATIDPATTDFSAAVAKIVVERPDAVFFNGAHTVGGRFSAQLAAAGLNVPLAVTGYPSGREYSENGGRDGDFTVDTGAPNALLPAIGPFSAAYDAAGFGRRAGVYAPFTYDATQVLVRALGSVLATGAWDVSRRADLIGAIQRTDLAGVTGRVTFDEFGDNLHPVYTVYELRSGEFVPIAAQTAPG